MPLYYTEVLMVAVVVAIACALPGVFLVLRKMALLSDAISHAILFGIVVAFLMVRNLESPLLIVGAAVVGVLVVVLVELLNKTRLVKEDTAIGLVFPALFALGVILVASYTGDVHLDIDSVLFGQVEFSFLHRMEWRGTDLGPYSLIVMGIILFINALYILLFYKELKLSTFDVGLAASLGFLPGLLHYTLMTLVSVTAVGAFDAVGPILVVALMIIPPATAQLLSKRLSAMIGLTVIFAVSSAVGGFFIARWLDVSMAGTMSVFSGIQFFLVYTFAPRTGLLANSLRRKRQKGEFRRIMLLVHLSHHENTDEEETECRIATLHEHLHWKKELADRSVEESLSRGLVSNNQGVLRLTEAGKSLASTQSGK